LPGGRPKGVRNKHGECRPFNFVRSMSGQGWGGVVSAARRATAGRPKQTRRMPSLQLCTTGSGQGSGRSPLRATSRNKPRDRSPWCPYFLTSRYTRVFPSRPLYGHTGACSAVRLSHTERLMPCASGLNTQALTAPSGSRARLRHAARTLAPHPLRPLGKHTGSVSCRPALAVARASSRAPTACNTGTCSALRLSLSLALSASFDNGVYFRQ
jgi:hypothetical protein